MNNMNIKHYRNMGYEVKIGDEIKITTSQLTKGSPTIVKVKCDYCGDIIDRKYKDHLKIHSKSIDKDSCVNCSKLKTRENLINNYGVSHIRQLPQIEEKIRATNLKKYGVELPFMSEDIRNKGVSTVFEQYGVDNIFKIENFKDIRDRGMLDTYGYLYPIQQEHRRDEILHKRWVTMNERNNVPTSSQQKYIHSVLGGTLNLPFNSLCLDIAFEGLNIYLEYQGSGHDLNVKTGKISKEDFKIKEMKRYYYMKNKGWKMLEIISTNDMLPKKEKLIEMFEFSKEILDSTSFIQFDINNNTVKYNKSYYDYNYDELFNPYVRNKPSIT